MAVKEINVEKNIWSCRTEDLPYSTDRADNWCFTVFSDGGIFLNEESRNFEKAKTFFLGFLELSEKEQTEMMNKIRDGNKAKAACLALMQAKNVRGLSNGQSSGFRKIIQCIRRKMWWHKMKRLHFAPEKADSES